MSQQFITFVPPPGPGALPSPPPPPFPPVPSAFHDALTVRRAVFVDEQRCALENEQDADDARSCHWVAYASVSRRNRGASNQPSSAGASATGASGSPDPPSATQVPAATIRLVPPPHAPHPLPGSVDSDPPAPDGPDGLQPTAWHDGREAYVKLGRLATVRAFRGLGLGRLLVSAALEWAAAHREALRGGPAGALEREREREREVAAGVMGWGREREWRGLVMVHAQKDVVPFYESCGFAVDPELGEWWEEHILHVAMWRRIALEK